MSRIRSIHPRLFTDECFASASPIARLLIIGLWTEAWDDGVFDWKPLVLKMRLFPADTIDVEPLLAELAALNIITRFESDGRVFGAIRNFCKFQRPKKPNASGRLPDALRAYVAIDDAKSSFKNPKSSELGGSEGAPSSEPVRNQFGTGVEPVRNQFGTSSEFGGRKGGREEGRKEEVATIETNPPDSGICLPIASQSAKPAVFEPSPAKAADPTAALDEDPKEVLFGEATRWLSSHTGRSPAQVKSAIGRMLKCAGGDKNAALVLGVIRDAKREGKSDPLTWAMAMFTAKSAPGGVPVKRAYVP